MNCWPGTSVGGRSSRRGLGSVGIVELQAVTNFGLPAIFHLHACADLEYAPTSGLQAELARPVADPSDGIGKGRMEHPFNEIN